MDALGPVAFPATIPTVETDRLTLRALTPEDRAAVFALFSDPRVALPTDITPFERMEQADDLIAFFARRFVAKGGIRWGLTLRGDDTVIGTAGFPGIDDEAYRAEIGYDLAYDCWGRGLATEAVRARPGRLRAVQPQPHRGHHYPGQRRLNAGPGQGRLRRGGHPARLRDYRYWRGAFYDLRMHSLLRREYAG